MSAGTFAVSLPGQMLQRGFWLYVWVVKTPTSQEWLYVGRTGDNSSPFATAIYQRMSQHLGRVKNQNALRRHLETRNIDPATCNFHLVAHGPIFPEQESMAAHLPIRNVVGAMEKALAEELRSAGYDVLNQVKWKHPVTANTWSLIRDEFCDAFPKLRTI